MILTKPGLLLQIQDLGIDSRHITCRLPALSQEPIDSGRVPRGCVVDILGSFGLVQGQCGQYTLGDIHNSRKTGLY